MCIKSVKMLFKTDFTYADKPKISIFAVILLVCCSCLDYDGLDGALFYFFTFYIYKRHENIYFAMRIHHGYSSQCARIGELC